MGTTPLFVLDLKAMLISGILTLFPCTIPKRSLRNNFKNVSHSLNIISNICILFLFLDVTRLNCLKVWIIFISMVLKIQENWNAWITNTISRPQSSLKFRHRSRISELASRHWRWRSCNLLVPSTSELVGWYSYELQLHSSLRRSGIGRQFMQVLELIGLKLGISKVMLTVFTANTSALAFYTTLGYIVLLFYFIRMLKIK